ncbi:MAG: MFS transporter, partial [Dehalococcoidia bacterium]
MRLSRNVRGIINLYTGTLLSGMGFSMVLPIMAILGEEFGVATGTVAQIVTAYALGRTAGIPVAGIFADRLGTRVSLIAGPVLVLGGAAIGVVTPWLWPIFAAMFIAGAGDSLWAMGREIAGIDLVRSDQRGRVMSGFHGLHAAGMALGPLLGGVLADVINFRAVFVAFVIIAAAAVALGTFAHNAHASRAPAASGIGKKGGIVERVKGIGELVKEIEPGLRLSYAVFVFATIGG